MSGLAEEGILRAAVARFARDGFDAPLRVIADDAGVSAALLIKRFGSKEGLRRACDDLVLDGIRAVKRENIRKVDAGNLLAALSSSDEHAPLVGYAMQSVLDGGALGREFVRQMIEDAVEYTTDAVDRGLVRPSRDERARVRYLVLSAVGAFLLTMLLDPPDDPSDLPALMRRLQAETTLPMLEVFTDGLFTTRQLLDDYLVYISDPPEGGANSTEPPRSPQPRRADPA